MTSSTHVDDPQADLVFHPAFSPASCYLLRDQDEAAYFARHGGAPEAALIDWATQIVRSDQSFIDVGAHIGSWSQHFAQKCKRVYAFEPQRATFARLREGIRRSGLSNISCHEVAIGTSGDADLHVLSADGGGSTLHPREELGDTLSTQRVRGAQLDAYEFDAVGLIKIDAEGAEGDILRGAIKTLQAHHYPTLLLEAWLHDWYAEARAALIAQVEAMGYHVQPVMNCPEMLLAEHPARHLSKVPVGDRPLLGLVMIVKNEVKRLADVLASYRPHIDAWTILDTGSTDGTQDLIHDALAGISGTLHEEPFVDFATSRNRALALHGTSTVFSIMPNGDVLEGGTVLRTFLEGARVDRASAYRVRIQPGHYYHPLVMRCGAGWRYKWRTHECAMGSGLGPQIPGVSVVRDRGSRTDEEWRARWLRDLDLLNQDRLDDPNDPRPYFYLGQTHECLGQYAEALPFFEQRVKMGGYFDEVFEAKFRIAEMTQKTSRPWAEAQQKFLEAHAHDPRRAEPLYAIAEHWYGEEQHAIARIFAAAAAELPKPPTDLFLDEEVYSWRAADMAAISSYYAGRKASGRHFADQAIKGNPNDERLRANRAFYAQSARELFGATARAIDFQPEPGWTASNPSIYDGYGGLRCVVRTVNYRIVNGRYVTPPQDIVNDGSRWQGWQLIRTRNFLLNLDDDLKTTRAVELVDQTGGDRTSYPVHGFEDMRLFEWRGRWWATATVCDFTDDGQREIALLELDLDGAVVRAEPLRGPWSDRAQKNWMPFIDGDVAKIIYATFPPTVFDLVGADDRDVRRLSWHVSDQHAIGCAADVSFAHGRLRGGSQGVRVDSGWLFVVHDVTFPGGDRIYLHRFALLSDQLKLTALTDAFYFEHRGIEFCAGLAQVGDKLVASYAVNDGSARLGIFDLAAVLAALREDFMI
jgi:FkbM family methyltransferase